MVVMTTKTVTGIDDFIDKKGYGTWFNQLFSIVKTRDSCQPDRAVEPSCSTPKIRPEGENLPEADESL